MTSMVPNERDYVDAYGDLDQDELYYENLAKACPQWTFETVDGLFMQSSGDTNDMDFDYVQKDFGITKSWDQIIAEINRLNAESPSNEVYTVFFLARHGQGWHNIVSRKYSKKDWMEKWRFLGTDGEMTWGPDAQLTELGIQQANENRRAWNTQLQKGAPFPTKFLVSPLSRSIHTLELTWRDQAMSPAPLVVENLRETIGVHLCHQRSTKSELADRFPFLEFESTFREEDELAREHSVNREQLHQQFMRINRFLQSHFENEWSQSAFNPFVSITSHAGTIRSFITVVGHRKFTIPTGGMVPIVVKATRRHT